MTCPECGKVFEPNPRGANKFCSQRCAARQIGRVTMNKNRMVRPDNRKPIKCCHCGADILRWKSNIVDSGLVYCNSKCAIAGGKAHRTAATRHARGSYTANHAYSSSKRGWRVIGGERVFFRSRMEANYARYLTFLGIKWKYEPDTFWFEGIKRGVMSYTPDFFIVGENTYIECKGWMDKKSKTKLKRMAKYHPNVKLTLVDWSEYRAIERGLGKVIPDWEYYERKPTVS